MAEAVCRGPCHTVPCSRLSAPLRLPKPFHSGRPQCSWSLRQRSSGPARSYGSALRVRASAEAGVQATTAPAPVSTAALTYTSFEGNSWKVDFAKSGVRVLVDPWLVDRLVFAGQDWLYAGSKRVARPDIIDLEKVAAETDFILLTQSIDDHAHRPTLKALPKSLPVVGSPSAAKVALELGFKNVQAVDHGEEVTVCGGKMRVRATAGALVGPPWSKRENGFVLVEAAPGTASLYYEPHCDFDPKSVAGVAPVDVVVTPPASQILLGYPLVKGATDNRQLLGLLRPKVVIPLLNAEFEQSGPLADLLEEVGSVEELEAQLARTPGLQGVRVQVPAPGQPMPVTL